MAKWLLFSIITILHGMIWHDEDTGTVKLLNCTVWTEFLMNNMQVAVKTAHVILQSVSRHTGDIIVSIDLK